ncbi:hypothetical protein [Ruegeria sp. Alg231-54]|uniref:hypothetical protein n=1 Tax=Ruegeria sp. Alg231-54 TaxID=1922221 RepID=UPI000D558A73|nr:hypothetical protein [Ruegeria sp. Alg231-54]
MTEPRTYADVRANISNASEAEFYAAAFCDAMTIDSGEAVLVALPDPEADAGLAVAASQGWYETPAPQQVALLRALRQWAAGELEALGEPLETEADDG